MGKKHVPNHQPESVYGIRWVTAHWIYEGWGKLGPLGQFGASDDTTSKKCPSGHSKMGEPANRRTATSFKKIGHLLYNCAVPKARHSMYPSNAGMSQNAWPLGLL